MWWAVNSELCFVISYQLSVLSTCDRPIIVQSFQNYLEVVGINISKNHSREASLNEHVMEEAGELSQELKFQIDKHLITSYHHLVDRELCETNSDDGIDLRIGEFELLCYLQHDDLALDPLLADVSKDLCDCLGDLTGFKGDVLLKEGAISVYSNPAASFYFPVIGIQWVDLVTLK